RGAIARIQLELYRLHPDKFTGGGFEKTAMANAVWRVWQGSGIILVLGLGIWLFPRVRPELISLGIGIACGVFLRAVNWKEGHRRMGFILWLGRWFLLLMVSSWIAISGFFLFDLLRHPYHSRDQMRPIALLIPGVLAGWLWVHLSLKYPAKSS